jgi:hypothetical protein
MDTSLKAETVRARSFGRTMGVVAWIAAVWFVRRARIQPAEVSAVVGVVPLIVAQFRPLWLRHPARLWFVLAHALGWFNARVLLTIAYAVVLTPISLVWRCAGIDPLRRRRSDPRWIKYPARYADRSHYTRMY